MIESKIPRGGADPDSEAVSIASSRGENGFSNSQKESSGAAFLSNLKKSSKQGADGIGKVGKGLFGKFSRSGSGGKEDIIPDEKYVCTVINLPLVEQTRQTRLSQWLEVARDKTEFWMPALPWRCIE
jgi:hypothetical protein